MLMDMVNSLYLFKGKGQETSGGGREKGNYGSGGLKCR